jgi:adenine deaminase
MAKTLEDFIRQIPKAELHLHIEGTLEPELMFEIALRNRKEIRYKSVEELRKAYDFSNLQDFLNIYYEGAGILLEEQDFYDMSRAYLRKAHSQNVLHTEIFFDPQTHTRRGIEFSTIIGGISRALKESNEKWGMSTGLIMCFLRHLDEESAMETLDQALIYKELITAVGLDSSEVGNPPSKFERVFDRARKEGFLTVAHAGEEGPASYVGEALDLLDISRVDHGNNSLDDERIVQELVSRKIPLTVCPLSNLKLKVVQSLKHHPLKEMLNKGLLVTVNSDDPAYFGGYVNENYLEISKALDLTREDIVKLARNSFVASFMDEEKRQLMISRVERFYRENRA